MPSVLLKRFMLYLHKYSAGKFNTLMFVFVSGITTLWLY
jgi:hypothetical protein